MLDGMQIISKSRSDGLMDPAIRTLRSYLIGDKLSLNTNINMVWVPAKEILVLIFLQKVWVGI